MQSWRLYQRTEVSLLQSQRQCDKSFNLPFFPLLCFSPFIFDGFFVCKCPWALQSHVPWRAHPAANVFQRSNIRQEQICNRLMEKTSAVWLTLPTLALHRNGKHPFSCGESGVRTYCTADGRSFLSGSALSNQPNKSLVTLLL